MTIEEHRIVAELNLRLEEAEGLLQRLIDDEIEGEALRNALEGVHVATINFNSFISDLTN